MITLQFVLVLIGVILLVLDAFPIPNRVNLLSLGLAFIAAGVWLVPLANSL